MKQEMMGGMASNGPYANQMHLPRQISTPALPSLKLFTGQMLFLMPNQK